MSRFLIILLLLATGSVVADQAQVPVGDFSGGSLSGWDEEVFDGETAYELVDQAGTIVLRAHSQNSASGLVKRQRIDLQRTPWLNWRWKISERLPLGNEETKAGDDYAARVYFVVSGGWRFWRTRAINYVWAREKAVGAVWPNPFAGENVQMMALCSGEAATGEWYQERRNVLQDLRRLVDPDIRYIDAVAVMTDTDNTGASVTSYYGDITFTAQ